MFFPKDLAAKYLRKHGYNIVDRGAMPFKYGITTIDFVMYDKAEDTLVAVRLYAIKMDTKERPSLTFYHANGKGTGSAMKMELYPARIGDSDSGAIYMTIARQESLGDHTSTPPVYPRFDWNNALKVRLDFTDLAKILQVLRGETESTDDGKGLFHIYTDKCQEIRFRHMIEPICCYSLDVMERLADVNAQSRNRKAYIFLSTAEALGLSCAIEHSFAAIAFGVPVI